MHYLNLCIKYTHRRQRKVFELFVSDVLMTNSKYVQVCSYQLCNAPLVFSSIATSIFLQLE